MQFSEYQKESEEFILPQCYNDFYMVTGLMSEVGEVAELIQKRIRGDKGYQDEGKFIEKLEKELGDILWHVASICNVYELDLNEVADINIAKLTSRKERNMIQGNGDDR